MNQAPTRRFKPPPQCPPKSRRHVCANPSLMYSNPVSQLPSTSLPSKNASQNFPPNAGRSMKTPGHQAQSQPTLSVAVSASRPSRVTQRKIKIPSPIVLPAMHKIQYSIVDVLAFSPLLPSQFLPTVLFTTIPQHQFPQHRASPPPSSFHFTNPKQPQLPENNHSYFYAPLTSYSL